MAEFFRPEVTALVRRWREPLLAAAVVALGLWAGIASFGVLRWIGWGLIAAGLAWGFVALQRLRFARGGGGAGVVTIDERRVVYFGPETGGVADLDLLARLELEAGRTWRLTLETGETVEIPADAEHADALFDVFTALPGIRTEALLSALNGSEPGRRILWESPQQRRLRGTERPLPAPRRRD